MIKYLRFASILFSGISFAGNIAHATSSQWNGTVLGFEKQREGLLGDMMGIRPILKNNGFNYNLVYLNQMAYNVDGGYNNDKHLAYIDQFSLTFTQDLEVLTGIPAARIEGNIVNRNHDDNLTIKRIRDPRVKSNDSTQESYGRGSITRLGWLTFSRDFDENRLKWRIGMMSKMQTFDQATPCDFQTLMLCGGKSANAFLWSNWNIHTWGSTFAYKLTPELTLKTGIMEQNSKATDRSHAWSWSTKGSKGVILPFEVEMRTHINNLPGVYNIGGFVSNATQPDLYSGKSQPNGLTDLEGYKEYKRTLFFWSAANQQITQHSDDPNRGMSIGWNIGLGDQRSNYIHFATAASLRYRGLFDARPSDWIGIGVSYMDMSNHYRQSQYQQNVISGINDYHNSRYKPVPDHSIDVEMYYRYLPVSWLELQPGIQFWHRPGGLNKTDDAWISSFKTMVYF
ncbi:carbohydrate porin [Enterobacter sp. 10-1]|uniref:carbohydrate porin n=1 Tax=Raoultella sp. 10-1 TaxID=2683201 RepID=UPI000BA4DE85|nr:MULTISPECIES: carbohydrate porin [Enterobacteriaceae]MVT05944.1 carbohydrate porin [Raoultella sp. 10-1]PAC07779.1 carbohydrate porin [Enterobacter sp. 10-1]